MAATVFVQPLDLVKNRMQLSGKKQSQNKLPLAEKSKCQSSYKDLNIDCGQKD